MSAQNTPEIEIRYGLAEAEKVDALKGMDAPGITIRQFEPQEDSQWRTGILMARAKKLNKSLKIYSEAEREKLDVKLRRAREEGQVPFRIAGPKSELAPFLEETGLIELELLP